MIAAKVLKDYTSKSDDERREIMNIKKLSFSILIASTIILSGCSSKAASSKSAESNKNNTNTAAVNTNTSSNSQASVKTDFEPIKPNTVPQLSTEKKKQIDSKMNSALKNLDNTLKSIQDPSDINLDSTN
jgi:PBP1b-binding outer membrane lipoprotein LpoB